MPPITTLPRLPATDWSAAYGGRPGTPDPSSSLGAAVAGNIGNLGQLYNLSRNVNQFNTAQAALPLARNLPGYQSMIDQSSRNIGAELRGQVPGDVVNQLLRTAAERGLSAGGGSNTNAAFLAAIGGTSLGMMQQGEQNLTGAIARTPMPQLFNPAGFFTSPEQEQAAAMHGANVAAAPVPAAAARAAEEAAMRGLQQGAGAVGGAPAIPHFGLSSSWNTPLQGPGTVVAPSLGTGTVTGGGAGSPVNYDAWNSWAAGLPRTGTGSSPFANEEEALNWLGWDLPGNVTSSGQTIGAPAGGDTGGYYEPTFEDYFGDGG